MLNKCLKRTIPFLLVCLLLSTFTLESFATTENNEFSPRFTNTNQCSANFSVGNNTAYVLVRYQGYESEFFKAEITVKIQKRFLLVIWNDVDIGYPSNIWTDTSYDLLGTFEEEFPISQKGYYRALITVYVHGRSGAMDTIEFTREYEYK